MLCELCPDHKWVGAPAADRSDALSTVELGRATR
jgi:hypothetical protein